MEELFRTNNTVSLSFAASLLKGQDIVHFVADQHMSILDGSIGMLPRRMMVDGDKLDQARRLMLDAGLGDELPETPVRDRA